MIERTISQSMYNARIQELEDVKRNIYREHLDDLTIRKMRHEMQGKAWTEADEAEYKKTYTKCSELIAIEEQKPLFNPEEQLKVVTDEEYAKLLEEQEAAFLKQEEQRRIEEQKAIEAEQQRIQEEELKIIQAEKAATPKAKKQQNK